LILIYSLYRKNIHVVAIDTSVSEKVEQVILGQREYNKLTLLTDGTKLRASYRQKA
jgi:hypothetical protein